MVPSTWSSTRCFTLFLSRYVRMDSFENIRIFSFSFSWCLVCRLYICWNVYKKTIISRWFRNRSTLSHFSVGKTLSFKHWDSNLFCSTLGTPTDETWPGVVSLPEFKSSFPRWKQSNDLSSLLNDRMRDDALDLLLVREIFSSCFYISMLSSRLENAGLWSRSTYISETMS